MSLLTAQRIVKRFGATTALDAVDFELNPGEVHALVGENGSGKSTLMRILAGVQRPSAGTLLVDGEEREYHRPAQATADGIVLVTQEGSLMPDLSASENIFVGRLLRRHGRVDWPQMHRRAAELLEGLSVEIEPRRPVGTLAPDQRQIVEIARALSYDARVLLLDEPTSTLDPHETAQLLEVVRGLAERGMAIVFVSHRLPEIVGLSNTFTVLRDGKLVDSKPAAEVDEGWLVRAMVGRELEGVEVGPAPPRAAAEPRLEVSGISDAFGRVNDVSLQVRRGEIVGLAGLVGAGRSEILETILGRRHRVRGEVKVDGEVVDNNVRAALRKGLALVSEDRQAQGLLSARSVHENATLTLPLERRRLIRQRRGEERASEPWLDRLAVKYEGPEQSIVALSGGNQQKVLLARALVLEPRVLMLDEPTRGIDLGAKHRIYEKVIELAESGLGILLASSELPEILALCHRVAVVRDGAIVGEFERGEGLSEEQILSKAAGAAAHV